MNLATFISLLTLVAAFSGWSLDLRELPAMGRGFWVGMFLAWTLSVYLGGIAASRSVPPNRTGRVLNACVSWAATTVFATTSLMMITNQAFSFVQDSTIGNSLFWIAFLGNTVAGLAAVMAGRGSISIVPPRTTQPARAAHATARSI